MQLLPGKGPCRRRFGQAPFRPLLSAAASCGTWAAGQQHQAGCHLTWRRRCRRLRRL